MGVGKDCTVVKMEGLSFDEVYVYNNMCVSTVIIGFTNVRGSL